MINRYNNKRKNKERFAKCKYDSGSTRVQTGIALTPSQMYGMALQGKPISTFNLPIEYFDNGQAAEANEIHVPMEEKRGVDVNDLFQRFKEVDDKFRKYRNHKAKKNVESKE